MQLNFYYVLYVISIMMKNWKLITQHQLLLPCCVKSVTYVIFVSYSQTTTQERVENKWKLIFLTQHKKKCLEFLFYLLYDRSIYSTVQHEEDGRKEERTFTWEIIFLFYLSSYVPILQIGWDIFHLRISLLEQKHRRRVQQDKRQEFADGP